MSTSTFASRYALHSLLAALAMVAAWIEPVRAADAPDFDRDVAPILIRRCLACHHPGNASGELVLADRDSALRGGESGPVIAPGDPDASYLLDRVIAEEMPPEERGQPQPLPPAEVDTLRRWVAAGAVWPADRKLDLFERTTDVRAGRDWWSLQPIRRPPLPPRADFDPPGEEGAAENPVDRFVAARLHAADLTPAPPADRATLIRRLYFDLLGLPPTSDEVDAFASDPAPDAYRRLVERLLASPHFGERWARYWLDLVRYAETCGYERDQPKPAAHRYRDWVVDAINADIPYDQFVTRQLAGDEITARDEQSVIATGFLRLGTWNDEPNDNHEYKYERLEDMVHATSSAFLGLTVKCARCHDHKFDPIPQRDYYRLAAAFWAGPIEPRDRKFLGGPTPDELGFDVLGWTDLTADPPPFHLLEKGDPHRVGPVVEPAQLSLVSYLPQQIAPPPDGAQTTHRRLQLARWITHPKNPLTARVVVNRLWQHHFGQPLVRSPNNFGFTGEQPTHPDLLDWLASELISAAGEEPSDSAWRLKRIHRLLVTSRTYQQSALHPRAAEYDEHDFTNRLLWRANRRRLDAEALRDRMLSAAGTLDVRLGGPSFRPTVQPAALEGLSRKTDAWNASPPEEQFRRSLYIYSQRSLLVPLLTTFDFSDTTLPCAQRDVTTVAPQALALLNNAFVHSQSAALADRVLATDATDPTHLVTRAFRLALTRDPTPAELRDCLAHLETQTQHFSTPTSTEPTNAEILAWQSLCHVLLNSNEFIYVD